MAWRGTGLVRARLLGADTLVGRWLPMAVRPVWSVASSPVRTPKMGVASGETKRYDWQCISGEGEVWRGAVEQLGWGVGSGAMPPARGWRMAVGLRQRHRRDCRGGRCECSWEASVYSVRDGRKIRKTFPSQAAARAWRDDTRVAVRRMLVRAPSSVTLTQAGAQWFKGARDGTIRTRSGDVYKPAAIRAYEIAFRLRVKPKLGSMRVSQVTRSDVQDLVDDLVAKSSQPSTIVVTVSAIRVIYKRALARGEVAVNPVVGVQLPAVRGRRTRIATPSECARLLAALPARDRPLWATAMYAGLRRGELMALHVDDVDLGRGVIHVRRGWDIKAGEITTKSRRERVVPIPATLREHLKRHLLNLGWQEGLVFGVRQTRPFNGTPLFKRAERAWDAAGLTRITLHECRHTFASLMIAAGVNAKALSSYMGHAGISITLDRYGHLMPGSESQAAGMLDDYLSSGAPGLRQGRPSWPPAPGASRGNGSGATHAILATNLASRRRALGLTQSELAARAGMSPSLISRIESGGQPPTVRTLVRLAEALGANLTIGLDRDGRASEPATL